MPSTSSSIYIHFPFCKTRCSYCAFYSQTDIKDFDRYVDALLLEAESRTSYLPDKNIATLYLGGGTPSLFPTQTIVRLMEKLSRLFNIQENAEMTIEVNPDDINSSYLSDLKKYSGINRISVGIQSFDDRELAAINRRHNSLTAKKALENIAAFFDNYSLDLIYGLPFQSVESYQNNLETALLFHPRHISAYALSVEQGTQLEKDLISQRMAIPGDDMSIQCYHITNKILGDNNFEHYEISNYALAGYKSKHNSRYWTGDNYLGLGAGAHSFNTTTRRWNFPSVERYIKSRFQYEEEQIDKKTALNEYIMLGLRTKNGVNLDFIDKKFGHEYKKTIERLSTQIPENHLIVDGMALSLNEDGMLFADKYASILFFL